MWPRIPPILLVLHAALAGGSPDHPDAALAPVFANIDRAATGFKSLSADMRRLTHTDAINADDVDSGTIKLKRPKPHDMRVRIDITQPEPKSLTFQGKKAEVYYPRIETVQEYDLGSYRDLVDEILVLGFGSTSRELQAAYTIRLLGPETAGGEKATRLELIPKSKELLQHLKKVELWIADSTGLPVQEKYYTPGQFGLVTYSNIRTKPDLPDSALKLQLPKNVKREFPQK
jgi:outer membrane lipoprotein-sorting protein